MAYTTPTPLHEPYCQWVRKPLSRSDFIEGLARLAASGLVELTDVVESIHREVVVMPFAGHLPILEELWDRGISGKVYKLVKSIMSYSGHGTATALRTLNQRLDQYERGASLPKSLKVLNNAINGVMGDHLIYMNNPLALSMLLYDRYGNLHSETRLKGRVLIMVHGLCMSYHSWNPGTGRGMGEHIVYAEPDTTILYLDYNTGRRISQNGRSLTELLVELTEKNPEITQIDFVCHSMGGLVTRSAMFYAKQDGHAWMGLVKNLICLASPHHGAVLERFGFFIQDTLSKIPIARNLAIMGDLRSAGIIDLRHGSVRDDDWEYLEGRMGMLDDLRRPAPLPANIHCYLVAATLDKSPSTSSRDIIGDGLVSIKSALGEHPGDHNLNVPEAHKAVFYGVNHMEVQHHPRVRDQVIRWLGQSKGDGSSLGQRIISISDEMLSVA